MQTTTKCIGQVTWGQPVNNSSYQTNFCARQVQEEWTMENNTIRQINIKGRTITGRKRNTTRLNKT